MPDMLMETPIMAAYDGRTFKSTNLRMVHHKGTSETKKLLNSCTSFTGKILACDLTTAVIGLER